MLAFPVVDLYPLHSHTALALQFPTVLWLVLAVQVALPAVSNPCQLPLEGASIGTSLLHPAAALQDL